MVRSKLQPDLSIATLLESEKGTDLFNYSNFMSLVQF
jgi:hypothetical protein